MDGEVVLEEVEERDEPQCCCFEIAGDNDQCPVHGKVSHA